MGAFVMILSAAIGTLTALSVGLLVMIAAAHYVDRYPLADVDSKDER